MGLWRAWTRNYAKHLRSIRTADGRSPTAIAPPNARYLGRCCFWPLISSIRLGEHAVEHFDDDALLGSDGQSRDSLELLLAPRCRSALGRAVAVLTAREKLPLPNRQIANTRGQV